MLLATGIFPKYAFVQVNGADIELFLVEGEEEEEQRTKANVARKRALGNGPVNKKRKSGGYGGRGGKNKRQRT